MGETTTAIRTVLSVKEVSTVFRDVVEGSLNRYQRSWGGGGFAYEWGQPQGKEGGLFDGFEEAPDFHAFAVVKTRTGAYGHAMQIWVFDRGDHREVKLVAIGDFQTRRQAQKRVNRTLDAYRELDPSITNF
jgi:hypothetical protein